MKPAALVIYLLLAACAAGCAPPGDVRHAQTLRPSPAAQPAPAAAPTPFADEPHIGGGVEIVKGQMKEKNERLLYELDVRYPQIARPRTRQERGFNRHVRGLVAGHVRSFKEFCAGAAKREEKGLRRGLYSLDAEFEVLYATPRLVSVMLTEESFTGYLNSDWFTVPLNYDLKAGRPFGLSELFRPGANYLDALASHSVAELERRGLSCGGTGIADEKKFREGTRPTAENYEGWNLTRRGIRITFGEYQIGPGCLGLVEVVVPYEQLRDVLRADAPPEHVG